MSEKKNKKAFTLIELLVAGVITSVLGLALLSIFSIGIRSYNRIKLEDQVRSKMLIAVEKIEQDLVNTFFTDAVGFTGDEQSVSFPELNEQEKLYKISYYSQNNIFYRKLEPFVEETAVLTSERKNEINLGVIGQVVFNYYGIDKISAKYEWKKEWRKEEGIPKLVKIILKSKQNNRDVRVERVVFIPLEKSL